MIKLIEFIVGNYMAGFVIVTHRMTSRTNVKGAGR